MKLARLRIRWLQLSARQTAVPSSSHPMASERDVPQTAVRPFRKAYRGKEDDGGCPRVAEEEEGRGLATGHL